MSVPAAVERPTQLELLAVSSPRLVPSAASLDFPVDRPPATPHRQQVVRIQHLVEMLEQARRATPAALRAEPFLLEREQYLASWVAAGTHLGDLLAQSASQGRPFSLLSMGVVSHRSFSLDISIPTFELSPDFARRFRLRQRSGMAAGGGKVGRPEGPKYRLAHVSATMVADLAGEPPELVLFAIENVVNQIGLLASQGGKMSSSIRSSARSGPRALPRLLGLGDFAFRLAHERSALS